MEDVFGISLDQAHLFLDMVAAGLYVPAAVVWASLAITGDVEVKHLEEEYETLVCVSEA